MKTKNTAKNEAETTKNEEKSEFFGSFEVLRQYYQ